MSAHFSAPLAPYPFPILFLSIHVCVADVVGITMNLSGFIAMLSTGSVKDKKLMSSP